MGVSFNPPMSGSMTITRSSGWVLWRCSAAGSPHWHPAHADVVGTVAESIRPTRLVTTWSAPEGTTEPSRVTFDIEPHGPIVRLTVTHEDLTDANDEAAASLGWPAVLSNLKSFLETGHPLPREPWLSYQ